MGYHSGNGKLVYAGRVGTGFNETTLASLHARLQGIVADQCPFSRPCSELASGKEATWVKPELVAEVEFSNWTDEKIMCQGKIFVDYLRNRRGAIAIAPYSTRACAGATVSVPISWRELNPKLRSDEFTIRNLPHRLDRLRKDLWGGIHRRSPANDHPFHAAKTETSLMAESRILII